MSRLSLALEDAEIADDAVVADGTDLSVAEATVEAQAGAAEVTEAASDVETFDSAVAEASEDTATVEQVAETVADSLDEEGPTGGEGMDPVAATLATETIERIRRKYRISSGVRSAPALESFKPRASRKEMTRLALESFSDTLKKMWERIKAFFRGLWDKIKSAVKSIFQSNIKTEKRALELKKKINTWKFNIKDKSSIESGSIASAFSSDGKSSVATIELVLGNHEKLLSCIGDVNKTSNETAKSISDLMAAIAIAAKKSELVSFDSEIKGMAKHADNVVAAFTSKLGGLKDVKANRDFDDLFSGNNYVKEGSEVNAAGPFYGSKYLYVAKLKHKSDKPESDTEEQFTISAEFRKIGKEPSKSIDTGTEAELSKICDTVIKICQGVAQAERAVKLGDTAASQINAAIDSALTMIGTMRENDENNKTRAISGKLNYVRASTTSIIKILTTSNGVVLSNTMSAANTALDYVDASMKAYKQ